MFFVMYHPFSYRILSFISQTIEIKGMTNDTTAWVKIPEKNNTDAIYKQPCYLYTFREAGRPK